MRSAPSARVGEPIVCGRARAYKRWSHPSSECARPAAAPERDGRGSSTALTNTASTNAPIGLGIRAPLASSADAPDFENPVDDPALRRSDQLGMTHDAHDAHDAF